MPHILTSLSKKDVARQQVPSYVLLMRATNFGSIGRCGDAGRMETMKWRLVFDGVVIGYANEAEHFRRTIEVLGGGSVEPVEQKENAK
jgi:hypothetical protein